MMFGAAKRVGVVKARLATNVGVGIIEDEEVES
jgi:hypothetical protein